MCHFAIGQPPSAEPPSDYELSSTRRGSLIVFDPQVYDGRNIVRFVNQGGLMEGLRALVSVSDRTRGYTTYSPNVAETIFKDRSCVVYQVCGDEMVMNASKPITSHPTEMIELLANYGLGYWIAHAVKYHRKLGHDTDLVKCSFWQDRPLCQRRKGSPSSPRKWTTTSGSYMPTWRAHFHFLLYDTDRVINYTCAFLHLFYCPPFLDLVP